MEFDFKCDCGKGFDIKMDKKDNIFNCPKCKTKWKVKRGKFSHKIFKWVD